MGFLPYMACGEKIKAVLFPHGMESRKQNRMGGGIKMIVNGIYKNHPVNPIPLMGFDEFAKALGFSNWDELIENSILVHSEAWAAYYITKMRNGKWAAWNTEDLHTDFVEFLDMKEEAVQYWKNYLRHVGLLVF